ncbi:MAG TPA: hypothetical protein VGR13_06960 [Actinomycetota bacterium]|nr:hypothetical protein [Actinomycetota bacterium]
MTSRRLSSFPTALLAMALVATACGGGGNGASGSGSHGNSIAGITKGAVQVSVVSSGSPVKPGKTYFGFGLITNQGGVITRGSPKVWVARNTTSKALGPFTATWYPFTPASEFDDTSPRSALPGTYATEIEVPSAGQWTVAVTAEAGGRPAAGTTSLTATAQPVPAEVGTKALSVETPVAHSRAEAREICTRTPPDPLHYISLDKALKNGKPTVVTFATPLLCESMLCGPVVDEVLKTFETVGRDKANFIHVEEFLPGPDLKPPPATLENVSSAFKAWGFTTEPWTIVVDGDGIIRNRFEGPVTAPQIEAALQALL